MPTWQFQSHLNPNHTLSVPDEVAAQLTPDASVQVVLISSGGEDEADWQRLAVEQFFKGYGPGDEIYDELPSG